MAFFDWKDSLTVGNPMIDRDHKMLIQYVNEMHQAMMAGNGKDIVGSILDKLVAYTKEHFGREEIFWKSNRLATFDQHLKRHTDILRQVADFEAKYKAGASAISIDLMNFLRDWLTNHIVKTDQESFKAISAVRTAKTPAPSAVRLH